MHFIVEDIRFYDVECLCLPINPATFLRWLASIADDLNAPLLSGG